MTRRDLVLLTIAAMLATAPAAAATATKHSGTISRIDRADRTLTLQEMGPWRGPGTGLSQRTIALEPSTKLALVQRSSKEIGGGWPGGYVESPLPASQLRPGDFATVTVARRDGRAVALEIDVVRPSRG